jgi:malto-oligosyltrehalose trehalohydrolase
MPFGAELRPDGSVRFRLWAPALGEVAVVLTEAGVILPMAAVGDGSFECVTRAAGAGSRYAFALPDGLKVPDPASREQPDDVHGASAVVDPRAYAWGDRGWCGRPWHETVVYELHLGSFGPTGGFDGVRRELERLARLGITAIELMPLAAFSGRRNWGYDGVLPFAPDASYGSPAALKRLIDAAHARGLMVFLDVVYNHFGPDGNYLGRYAPQFFTARHQTPWGAAIDFGERTVRDFFIHNALYWLAEYRFDGLRLDAVHAIIDESPTHILTELAAAVRRLALAEGRHLHLVLENDDNAARFLRDDGASPPCHYDAQWNDDFHHAAHVLLTAETGGYYGDYAERPLAKLGRALAEGFIYQGEASPHRGGVVRGEPSADLPPTRFVDFLQNHDQIGNRAFGERLTMLAAPAALEALITVLLLAPQVPLVFMGEEWGATEPFPFFCDYTGDLARAVHEGRAREFEHFPAFADPAARARIPDPNAPETFAAARIDAATAAQPPQRARLDLYTRLLALRHAEVVPRLAGMRNVATRHAPLPHDILWVAWQLADRSVLTLVARLGVGPAEAVAIEASGRLLHATHAGIAAARPWPALPEWFAAWFLATRDAG